MDKKRGNTVQTRNLSTDTGDRESVYPFKQGESVMGVDHGRNQRSTPQQSPIEESVTSVIELSIRSYSKSLKKHSST